MKIGNGQDAGMRAALNAAKKKYGTFLTSRETYNGTRYTATTGEETFTFEINAKNEAAITKATTADIGITYKKQYDYSYPALSKTIRTNAEGIFYYLLIDTYNTDFTIRANGAPVLRATGDDYDYQLILNPFILSSDEDLAVNIHVEPGINDAGIPEPVIGKRSYFEATLCIGKMVNGQLKADKEIPLCEGYRGYVTDTVMKNGSETYSSYLGNPKYGAKFIDCNYRFKPHTGYKLEGWKTGTDLRSDKKLKEKISALYEKLATTIRTKNAREFNELLIKLGEEKTVSNYNINPAAKVEQWEAWMDMFSYANVTPVEKDFDLKFSDDGKLVYAIPKTQRDMLRVIGKKQATGFTFYMYEASMINFFTHRGM